jgi:hypothetical protein
MTRAIVSGSDLDVICERCRKVVDLTDEQRARVRRSIARDSLSGPNRTRLFCDECYRAAFPDQEKTT